MIVLSAPIIAAWICANVRRLLSWLSPYAASNAVSVLVARFLLVALVYQLAVQIKIHWPGTEKYLTFV
jgi:hypothetical protein